MSELPESTQDTYLTTSQHFCVVRDLYQFTELKTHQIVAHSKWI